MKLDIILLGVLVLFITSLMMGCNRNSKPANTSSACNISYKLTKGRSKIKPYYTISLSGNDIVYTGLANMKVMGETTFKIDDEKLKTICSSFHKSNFNDFESDYVGKLKDTATSTIEYNGTIIRFYEKNAPTELINIVDLIRELVPK